MSSIYEDALADVKRLKELAEQNVTNALIESIAPNVRRMIERKLDIISTDGPSEDDTEDDPEDMLLDDVGSNPGVELQGVGAKGKIVLDLDKLTVAAPTPNEPSFLPVGAGLDDDIELDDNLIDLDSNLDDDDESVFEVTVESLEPLVKMMLESDGFVKDVDALLLETTVPLNNLIADVRYVTANAKTIARTAKRLVNKNKLDYDVYNMHVATANDSLFSIYKKLCECTDADSKLVESLKLELEIANASLNESPNKNVEIVRQQVIATGKRVKKAILEMKNGTNANTYKEIEGAFADFTKAQASVKQLIVTEKRDLQVDQIRQDLNRLLKECRLMARKNKLLNEEDLTLTLSLGGLPEEVTEEDLADVTVDVVGGNDDDDAEGAEAGDDMPDFGDFDVEDDNEAEETEVEETFVVEDALADMDDDTVVEIDENMLRKELRRMAEARHDAPPPDVTGGIDDAVLSACGDPDHAFLELGMDITGDGAGGNGYDPRGAGSKKGKKVHENVNESRNNRAIRQALTRQKNAIVQLREQLLEQNLLNLKLLYANRVLMNEDLARKTKAQMIKSLNEAKNVREVKLLYKSLSETVKQPGTTMNESRRRGGSSSRVTQSGGASRTEQAQTPALQRWQKLAGIKE